MYGKLFESTFNGSMVGAGSDVFAVWSYIIAHTRAGVVELNPKLVAVAIGCEVEDAERALEYLQKPDPSSRSKAEDGRRIVKTGSFAYRVVNHKHYREMRSPHDRREYMRLKQRESRARRKAEQGQGVSTPNVNVSTKTEAEAEDRDPSDPCQTSWLSDDGMALTKAEELTEKAKRVWEVFCRRRKAAVPGSGKLIYNDKRRSNIKARISEGRTGAEFKAAMNQFFDPANVWMLKGYTLPKYLFRSTEQFDLVLGARPWGQKATPVEPPSKPKASEDCDALYEAQLAAERHGVRKVGPTLKDMEGFDPVAARAKIEAELAAKEAAKKAAS